VTNNRLFIGAEKVFNARNLSPERVARTFIAPQDFIDLCQETHTVVMGPRGSGKTTLLKMLTPRALDAWAAPQANEIREEIPFDSIYIPSDIHWEEQLRSLSASLAPRLDYVALEGIFSQAAVTVNILLAVIDAMFDVIKLRKPEAARPMEDFLEVIIDGWKLKGVPPIAGAVRESLEARFNELFILFRRLASDITRPFEQEKLPDWVFLDYSAATRLACTAFDNTFPERAGRKWALCFDELELAPSWLQNRLFRELRSTDQRFLLKLSTSPLPTIGEDVWAAHSEDYEVIRLWPHKKVKARDFSSLLALAIIRERLGNEQGLAELLGGSTVASGDEESYSRNSPTWHVFRELAEKDPSFRALLEKHEVDPQNPVTNKRRVGDQVLRKAKPLAHFRAAWLTGDSLAGQRRVRTRKRPRLYHGVEDVLDIADGNPRWLITILRQLLRKREEHPERALPLPAEEQEEVLAQTSELFLGFLRTLPNPRGGGVLGIPLYELVEILGTAFEEHILNRPFSLNPVGTVRVELALPEPLLNCLRWAAEQGALIVMDPVEQGLDKGIEGRRLRLTFLLAPYFKLPLRAYKEARLTTCLRTGGLEESRLKQMELGYA